MRCLPESAPAIRSNAAAPSSYAFTDGASTSISPASFSG